MAKKINKSNPTIVVDKSGKILGEFPNQYDAENYTSSVGRQPIFFENLEPLEVYGQAPKKKRSFLEMGAANLEETFGLTPRDAIGFVPIVGDALDVYDIGDNLYNKNYTAAGLSLASLLLPDAIVKGGKNIYKAIKGSSKGSILSRINNLRREINNQRNTLLTSRNSAYDREISLPYEIGRVNNDIVRTKNKIRDIDKFLKSNNIRKIAMSKMKNIHSITESISPEDFIIGNYVDEFGNITPISINSNITRRLDFNPYYINKYSISETPPMFTKSDKLISLTGEREKRLQTLIGNSGILAGSSKLASSGYITHIPGDDDILTTVSRYNDLLSKINGTKVRSLRNNVGNKVKSDRLRGGESDIDIIEQDINGNAKGILAHELYAMQHPKEYKLLREKHAEDAASVDYSLRFQEDFADKPLPIKAEDLYNELTGDILTQKSLSDLLFSHNPKHAQRRLQLFANKDVYPAIEKSLNNKFQTLYGKDLNLPKSFKLNNIEANKKLLETYNLPTELAEDPKAMELLSKYLYLSEGSATRRTNLSELNVEDGEDFINKLGLSANATYSHKGGNSRGRGGNFTNSNVGGGLYYGPYSSIVTDDIPESITNPEELLNYLTGDIKITPEIKEKLSKTFGNSSNSYSSLGDIHYDETIIPNTSEANQQLANIFGRKFSLGTEKGSPKYIGRLTPAENIGTMYSPDKLTFEHGVLSSRSFDDNAKRRSLEESEFFNRLKGTEQGNSFQQEYMKNIKEAKRIRNTKIKRKKEAEINYGKLQEKATSLRFELYDIEEQIKNIDKTSKNLSEREIKLNKLRNKYIVKQKQYEDIAKYGVIGAGTIGLGTATYKILNDDKEDKKYYGGHISLEAAY